jgi:hypothetical protein
MIISHFKRLELILLISFTLMLSSVAASIVVMYDFFEKTSDKLDVLVQDAVLDNTYYDVHLWEYSDGSPYIYQIPTDQPTQESGIKEFKHRCDFDCEEECPDSVRVVLMRTVFNRSEILKDTMIYQ